MNSFSCKLRTKKSTIQVRHKNNVIRKPAKYKAFESGECVALDTMEFRQDGEKRYVVTVIDDKQTPFEKHLELTKSDKMVAQELQKCCA